MRCLLKLQQRVYATSTCRHILNNLALDHTPPFAMPHIQVRRLFTRRASKDSEPSSPETLRTHYAPDPSSPVLLPYSEANPETGGDTTWDTHIEARIALPARAQEFQLSRTTSVTDASSRHDDRSSMSDAAPRYGMSRP